MEKYKQTLSDYDIKGKENTLSTSENNEKVCYGYVPIYECGKHLVHSTYERVCTSQENTTNKIKEIVESFNSYIKEIRSTNQDMKTYIDSVKNKHAEYPEQNTAYFENVANITVNGDSVILQEEERK